MAHHEFLRNTSWPSYNRGHNRRILAIACQASWGHHTSFVIDLIGVVSLTDSGHQLFVVGRAARPECFKDDGFCGFAYSFDFPQVRLHT